MYALPLIPVVAVGGFPTLTGSGLVMVNTARVIAPMSSSAKLNREFPFPTLVNTCETLSRVVKLAPPANKNTFFPPESNSKDPAAMASILLSSSRKPCAVISGSSP